MFFPGNVRKRVRPVSCSSHYVKLGKMQVQFPTFIFAEIQNLIYKPAQKSDILAHEVQHIPFILRQIGRFFELVHRV